MKKIRGSLVPFLVLATIITVMSCQKEAVELLALSLLLFTIVADRRHFFRQVAEIIL